MKEEEGKERKKGLEVLLCVGDGQCGRLGQG